MTEHVSNPIGWMKVHVLHRCPRCGAKLVKRIATDETAVIHGNVGGGIAPKGPALRSGYTGGTRITPVYLVCPNCGFQTRIRNIRG